MKTSRIWFPALCWLSCCLAQADPRAGHSSPPAPHLQFWEKSVRGTIEDVPFVLLRGNVEERGRAYGALCGRDLVQVLDATLIPVLNAKSPQGWDELVASTEKLFLIPDEFSRKGAAFMGGLREALSESEQVLESLGRSIELGDLIALHAFPDLAGSGRVPLGGCSSFSAWGKLTVNGEVISGRNLDYFTFPGRVPIMIIGQEPSEPGRLRTLEISLPGILGASTAMNEEGVFLMLHDEAGLPPADSNGWVPRVFPLRQALERARAATAISDVAAALQETPLAMGANIHVSFPVAKESGLAPAVFEWDGNAFDQGVTVRLAEPELQPDALFCTNHYLNRRSTPAQGSSEARFNALLLGARTAAAEKRNIDLRFARELMDAAAVRGNVSTYLSVIAFPHQRQIHLALAPQPGASATDGAWVAIHWDTVFRAAPARWQAE